MSSQLTKEALSDLYDKQIDALLRDDYDAFANLTGDIYPASSHNEAWIKGNCSDISIFSFFPGVSVCASQIEHRYFSDSDKELCEQMREKVLAEAAVSLPLALGEDDARYTREQLEEFKRRQLVARFDEV